MKTLLATDGSPSATTRNAIDALMTHFNLSGAQITLMHVIEKPWLRLDMKEDWPEELVQSFAGELRSEAEQIVEGARELLGTRGLSAEALIEEGIPSNELLREVETGSYDLAIVGASGASDLKHTLLGSVAFKLAYNAPCSVGVVR